MEITSIFVIIAAILVFIILILALVYWKMSLDEKNGKEKKHTEIKEQGTKQQTKVPQSYNKQSIFSFMEFDKIEDNMIVQKNGKRYLMVVECQGINYDLMSRMEKNAVEEGFSQFLNTLRHPIQIYTQSRTINLKYLMSKIMNMYVKQLHIQLKKLSVFGKQTKMVNLQQLIH